MTTSRVEQACIPPAMPLRDAIRTLDAGGLGIVLVTGEGRRLLGTITDGDVRRAILAGRSLDLTAGEFLAEKHNPVYPQPVSAPAGTKRPALLRLMRQRTIQHLPLIDSEGGVADLVTLNDLIPDRPQSLQAVIMAGGLGTRLRPLTDDTPKPMLPVGGRPLLERTVARLRDAGVRQVSVSTFFRADKVQGHFKDGSEFGVDLEYVCEDRPLGTAGALSRIPVPTAPLLVMNGDILTTVDFRAMHEFHREHEAVMTVGVRKYDFSVPYGVVECDGVNVRSLAEKPTYSSFVNAGIYLLEPLAFRYVPKDIPVGEKFNMTDLITRLLEAGHAVVSFPIHEYWLDIGQPADYERAQDDADSGRLG
ncbi:MAG: nucleotidyltransferase family protein [Deltaproteobacteria bacterium]|nr:nucleotidyltransferase family protein [Deltaproteobacteria bacterium]